MVLRTPAEIRLPCTELASPTENGNAEPTRQTVRRIKRSKNFRACAVIFVIVCAVLCGVGIFRKSAEKARRLATRNIVEELVSCNKSRHNEALFERTRVRLQNQLDKLQEEKKESEGEKQRCENNVEVSLRRIKELEDKIHVVEERHQRFENLARHKQEPQAAQKLSSKKGTPKKSSAPNKKAKLKKKIVT